MTKKSFVFTFHNFLRIFWKKCYCRVRSWVRDKPGNNAMKTSSLLRLDAILIILDTFLPFSDPLSIRKLCDIFFIGCTLLSNFQKSEFKKKKKCPMILSQPLLPPWVSRIIWIAPYTRSCLGKTYFCFNILFQINVNML